MVVGRVHEGQCLAVVVADGHGAIGEGAPLEPHSFPTLSRLEEVGPRSDGRGAAAKTNHQKL
jgi:hypothetical protein